MHAADVVRWMSPPSTPYWRRVPGHGCSRRWRWRGSRPRRRWAQCRMGNGAARTSRCAITRQRVAWRSPSAAEPVQPGSCALPGALWWFSQSAGAAVRCWPRRGGRPASCGYWQRLSAGGCASRPKRRRPNLAERPSASGRGPLRLVAQRHVRKRHAALRWARRRRCPQPRRATSAAVVVLHLVVVPGHGPRAGGVGPAAGKQVALQGSTVTLVGQRGGVAQAGCAPAQWWFWAWRIRDVVAQISTRSGWSPMASA